MMKRLQRWAWSVLIAGVSGCGGEGGDAPPPYTVVLERPALTDVLYQNLAVEFGAAVTANDADFDPAAESFVFDWEFGDGAATLGVGADVTHAYSTEGQHDVVVTARRVDGGGDTVDEASTTVSIALYPAADLAVSGTTLSVGSAVVESGQSFRLSADVINNASRVASAFDVGFYVGDPEVVDPATPFGSAQLVAWIAAGEVVEVASSTLPELAARPAQALLDNQTLVLPLSVTSGEYVAFLFADPADDVGETDETNNAGFAERRLVYEATVGEGPDLSARTVDARPAITNVLSAVTVSAIIANTGTEFSPPFSYRVVLSAGDPTLDDADQEIGGGRVETLPSGSTTTISLPDILLSAPITTLGDYFVLLEVDSADEVAEGDETNNVTPSGRVTVTDVEIPGADIVPTSLSVAPTTTFLNGSVQIEIAVENRGTEVVGSQFNCKVYFSSDATLELGVDTLLQSMLLDPLAVGASTTQSVDAFVPGFLVPGSYTPILACDPSLLVGESDETNNVLVGPTPIEVAAESDVDLAATLASVEPSTVANGAPATVRVDICNGGSNGSTPSVVRVHLSADPLLDATDSVMLQSRVPPLDPGACITVQGEVAARCDTFVSSYTAFAVVDASDQVVESDEANNVLEIPGGVEITGLICACELDSLEPNDTPSTAQYLNPAIGAYPQRTMCRSNVDYYLIPLLTDETVRVTIRFESARGNLDVELFAPDLSTVLDRSATDGDLEEVSFIRVPQRGAYLLRVRGRDTVERNVYDLELEVSSPTAGTDLIVLGAEVSNDAPVLGETIETCFSVVNLGDTPTGASVARLYLSADTRVDPLTDPLLVEVPIPTVEDRVFRCVDVTIPDESGGGARYVGVVADARDDVTGELNESNNVGFTSVLSVDESCFDVLEPNNALDSPRLLDLLSAPPVEFSGLRVCSENRDVYEICLADGDFLSVDVAFDPAAGDVDVKLVNDVGVEIDRSEGIGDRETVLLDYSVGARCYRVEIYVAGLDRDVPYSMVVDSGPAPAELACSRSEEPNDTFSSAASLRTYLSSCQAVCPSADDDYYYLQLSAGATVTFELAGEGGAAPPEDLRLAFWGPSRNFLRNTLRADEVLTYTVPLTGRHYVRVRSNGDAARNQPYCLNVDGLSGVDLVPAELALEADVAEPGDTLRFDFVLSNTRDAASPAAAYAVYLSEDPVWDASDELLREASLDPLDGLTDRVEGRRFTLPADLAAGTYSVILVVDHLEVVAELNEANNIVHVPLVVMPRCTPDIAEPNNFASDAFAAAELGGILLASCGVGDDDWYWFDAGRPTATVSIEFFDSDGDLDLYVFTEGGALLASSDSISDGESVVVATTIGSRYLVLVQQHTDLSPEYTLTVD